MSYDDPDSSAHCRVGRSDSSVTTLSADSTLSPSAHGPVGVGVGVAKAGAYPSSASALSSTLSVYVNNAMMAVPAPHTPASSHKTMPVTEVRICL